MTAPDPRTTGAPSDPLSVGLDRPAASTEPARPTAPSGPGRTRQAAGTVGLGIALGLLIFVTIVLVLFVVYNGETVPISLVFTDIEAPLVVALLIAAALGALISGLLGLVLRARRRHR
ncbi:lipopolysaccharide assembly protein LapA domain-containing protein [Blastococcus sp. TF02-9]|uniref:lipopolysaccharide assembly protein LapA domain-containing protein n=1 Tax=Blastococcus sp. TF02-09 TaxID=2250576 RepID=UPI001F29DFD5|nr:lipopolysaccharide assembly protein LapA domain-containing protein [Blastococcus sp. TF02-9]